MNEGSGWSLPVLCLAWQDVSTQCRGTDSQNQLTAAECSFDAPMFISLVIKSELIGCGKKPKKTDVKEKSCCEVNVDFTA